MDWQLVKIVVCFLSGGFLIFLAIMVTRDSFASRLNRVTGAMLLFAGLGPLFVALGTIMQQADSTGSLQESPLYHLQHIWYLVFPLMLLFSWIFPVDRLRGFKHLRVKYLIFLPQLLHVALALFFDKIAAAVQFLETSAAQEGFSSVLLKPVAKLTSLLFVLIGLIYTYRLAIFSVFHLFYLILALYFLESGRRLVTNPRLLTQTRLVLWGTRAGGGLYTATLVASLLLTEKISDDLKLGLFLVALLIWTAYLIFAVIRHQFLDVRLVFRQSFVVTIMSGLLVGIYILVVVQARKILGPLFGDQAEVVGYGFIILILLLFQPINNWIDNLVQSMFIRTRSDHRNVLERFSRQVISLFDPRKLLRIIEETLKTALLVERVYFVLFDDTVGEYAILPGEGRPRRTVLAREDLMLRGINLLDTPTFMHSLSDYSEGSQLAAFLSENRIRLVLPLKDANDLLGFVALSDKAAGYHYSSEDINLLGVLSNQIVTALTNARLYVDSLERIRLQEEVNMARQIQLALQPSKPPQIESFTVAAHSMPSRTVGGDFYDFIAISDHAMAVVIADASGKGMPAALMIAQIQAMVRSEVNNGSRINIMMKNMNQQILRSSSAEKYATLFYGELDTRHGRFCYANAGHNYPILIRRNGEIELLKEGGMVIGALPHTEYVSCDVQLQPHDVLFLFTDGLSEAMDTDEQEYGEERICRMLVQHRDQTPQNLIDMILNDVRSHDPTYPPRDDTTIITIKMNDSVAGHG
ncbi:MAG: GAF domain-containing SpoIIE family protein phosphatase [bacterium]